MKPLQLHRFTKVICAVAYEIAKFLHITGVVMLMGNITVTAIWKYFADRTQQPEVLSFAQKLVTYTDWSMTVWGVVLLMGGGYFMVFFADWPLWLVKSPTCDDLNVIAHTIAICALSPVTDAVAPPLNAAQRLLQERGGAIRGTLGGSRLACQTARADDDLLTDEQFEKLLRPR